MASSCPTLAAFSLTSSSFAAPSDPLSATLTDVPAEDGLIFALLVVLITTTRTSTPPNSSPTVSTVLFRSNLPPTWPVVALTLGLLLSRVAILAGANPLTVGMVAQPIVLGSIATYAGVPLALSIVGAAVQWVSLALSFALPATVAALCVLVPALYLPGARSSFLTSVFVLLLILYLLVVPTGVVCPYSDWQSIKRGDPLPISFGMLLGMAVASIIVDERSEKVRSFLAERRALGGHQTILSLLCIIFGFTCVVAKGFLTSFSAFSIWPFVLAFLLFAKALTHPTIDAAALRVGRFTQARFNYVTTIVWLLHAGHVVFWLVILLTNEGAILPLKVILPIATFLLAKAICWLVCDDECHLSLLHEADRDVSLADRGRRHKRSHNTTRRRLVSRVEEASGSSTAHRRPRRREHSDAASPGDSVLGTTTSTVVAATIYHIARTVIAFFLITLVVAQGLTLPVAVITTEPHKVSVVLYMIIIVFYMLVSGGGSQDLCVVGHRGVWVAGVAENSYEAVDMMLDGGGDGVEVDVRATGDNVLIIMHDSTLDRTTAASGPVLDYTYAELADIPVTNSPNHIPTLEDMLLHVQAHPDNHTHINVDLKPTDDLLVAVNTTLDLLFSHGMENRSLIASGEYTYVNIIGERHPNIRVQRDALWYQSPATVFSSAAQYTGLSFELLLCNPGVSIQLAAVNKKLLLYYLVVDNSFTLWMGRLLGAKYILVNAVEQIEPAAGGIIDDQCSF